METWIDRHGRLAPLVRSTLVVHGPNGGGPAARIGLVDSAEQKHHPDGPANVSSSPRPSRAPGTHALVRLDYRRRRETRGHSVWARPRGHWICVRCQKCTHAETSPAPLSSERKEATVSRYEDWARHTGSWRWAGHAQAGKRGRGQGDWGRARHAQAHGAARALPSARGKETSWK